MSKKKEEEALVVGGVPGALAKIPGFMEEDVSKGTEGLGTGDYEIPRIKLIQELSEEKNAYDDAEPGMLFHTVADVILAPPVKIIPVYTHKSFILWKPRHMGGGILARSDDGIHWNPPSGTHRVKPSKDTPDLEVEWILKPTVLESGLSEWGSHNPMNPESPPAATEIYNVVVVFLDYMEISPVVLPMQRSQIRVARKFVSKIKMQRAPSFGQVYEMNTFLDRNNMNQEFWNYTFKASGVLADETTYSAMKEWYEQFKASGVKVRDVEGLQDDIVDLKVEGNDDAGVVSGNMDVDI